MDKAKILSNAFSMPMHSPAFPKGPYHFRNREYMIITYRTDPNLLRDLVPSPLEPVGDLVKFEFIRMPDSTGFGDYTESGQVMPVLLNGKPGNFILSMFLNDHAPIAGGRELWGFPKKLAEPSLRVEKDTLIGTLDYGSVRIATATMGYKHHVLDTTKMLQAFEEPNYLLKIIPHVDGSPRICELVRYYLEDVRIIGAWSGPSALSLSPHALANISGLPVREIVSASHIVADLTLGLGTVVEDYLAKS